MARLIDADYVLSALGIFNDRENGNEHFLNGIETAVEVIENAPTVSGWISTAEHQPDVMGVYLARLADGTYRILGYYDYIDFDKEPRWLEDYTAEELVEVPNVTHWCSLPEPPKEEDNG